MLLMMQTSPWLILQVVMVLMAMGWVVAVLLCDMLKKVLVVVVSVRLLNELLAVAMKRLVVVIRRVVVVRRRRLVGFEVPTTIVLPFGVKKI